jgi:hypothetical protein
MQDQSCLLLSTTLFLSSDTIIGTLPAALSSSALVVMLTRALNQPYALHIRVIFLGFYYGHRYAATMPTL